MVQVDVTSGSIRSVLRFLLPKAASDENSDNPEGFLVAGGLAMCQDHVLIVDADSGLTAIYSGQF